MQHTTHLIERHLLLFFLLNTFFISAQTQLGLDIDGAATGDNAGYAVSLSDDGTRMAVGAHLYNTTPGNEPGHVRLYEWNGTSWSQMGSDILGANNNDHFGFAVSLSGNGNRVVIGGNMNNGNGSEAGHTQIYEWNGSNWVQLGSDIFGEVGKDRSGYSVAISDDGSRVAIGAYLNDGNGSASGHIRIFDWNGSSWTQVGNDIDGEAAGDRFGFSVALSGDGTHMIGGGTYNNATGAIAGHARVFKWSGTQWNKVGSDIDGEAAVNFFGHDVDISDDGTRVAIGAPYNNDAGNLAGHVRVLDYNGSDWIQRGSDIDGEAGGDLFGWSVSISDDGSRVAVGAYSNEATGTEMGHTRIFQLGSSDWLQVGDDIDGESSNDQSGYGIALSGNGNFVAIGAPGNDGNGSAAGHVRIFDVCGNGACAAVEALPVELVYFEANPKNNEVVLYWETASERNNLGFEIQHSYDGVNFNVIGWVEGQGNTSNYHQYEFTDEQPNRGANYYRLKQLDNDGVYELSEVRTVSFNNETEAALSVFPNPAPKDFNISCHNPNQEAAQIQIFDRTGRQLWSQHFEAGEMPVFWNQKYQLTQPDVYFIILKVGHQTTTQKIIIADNQ